MGADRESGPWYRPDLDSDLDGLPINQRITILRQRLSELCQDMQACITKIEEEERLLSHQDQKNSNSPRSLPN
jgi:hypothetical protein